MPAPSPAPPPTSCLCKSISLGASHKCHHQHLPCCDRLTSLNLMASGSSALQHVQRSLPLTAFLCAYGARLCTHSLSHGHRAAPAFGGCARSCGHGCISSNPAFSMAPPRSGDAGSHVSPSHHFWGTTKLFSIATAHFTLPRQARVLTSPQPHRVLLCCFLQQPSCWVGGTYNFLNEPSSYWSNTYFYFIINRFPLQSFFKVGTYFFFILTARVKYQTSLKYFKKNASKWKFINQFSRVNHQARHCTQWY